MKKSETIEEMEKRDAAGYAPIPSRLKSSKGGKPFECGRSMNRLSLKQRFSKTAATGEKAKAMKKALEKAAEIRGTLEGRQFSDSTDDLIEDRKR